MLSNRGLIHVNDVTEVNIMDKIDTIETHQRGLIFVCFFLGRYPLDP